MIYENHPALCLRANIALAKWLGCSWDAGKNTWCNGNTGKYDLFKRSIGEDDFYGEARFALLNDWALYIERQGLCEFICEFKDRQIALDAGFTYKNGKYIKKVNPEKYFKDSPEVAYHEPEYVFDERWLGMLKTAPYSYQKVGIAKMMACRRVLNGDQMGLGKTLQALAVAAAELAKGGRVLVICPAFLKHNWASEIAKTLTNKFTIEVVGKSRKKKQSLYNELPQIMITNYERLGKIESFDDYSVVIVDECHMLKNAISQRARAFATLQKRYKGRIIFLSGTPIKNRVAELYNVVKWCMDGKLRLGTNEFCNKFSFPDTKGHKLTFRGVRNEMELRRMMSPFYIARKTEDVIDLPPLRRVPIENALAKGEDVLFGELEQAYENFMAGVAGEHIMHIRQRASGAKVPDTIALARQILDSGEQLVVWDCFKAPVALIAEALCGDYTVAPVDGTVAVDERSAIVELFQKGKIQCIVATIPSLSTGVTLTAATKCIFNSLDWVPAENLQAEKRIHRIGTTKPCTIYQMVRTGFDKKLMVILNEKMRVIEKALGST